MAASSRTRPARASPALRGRESPRTTLATSRSPSSFARNASTPMRRASASAWGEP